jgi:hypothetical protein
MKHLILTTDSSGAECLAQAAIADIVIPFDIRFTSGPLPSDAELANSLATRSTKSRRAVPYWLNDTGWRNEKIRRKGFGLIDLCEQCEAVELWIDPDPNAQLVLIWLLDYFRSRGSTASKLTLVQADAASAASIVKTLPSGGRRPLKSPVIISKPLASPGRRIERRRHRRGSIYWIRI